MEPCSRSERVVLQRILADFDLRVLALWVDRVRTVSLCVDRVRTGEIDMCTCTRWTRSGPGFPQN